MATSFQTLPRDPIAMTIRTQDGRILTVQGHAVEVVVEPPEPRGRPIWHLGPVQDGPVTIDIRLFARSREAVQLTGLLLDDGPFDPESTILATRLRLQDRGIPADLLTDREVLALGMVETEGDE